MNKKDLINGRLFIERMGFDEHGDITFLDCHDEKTGNALFFQNPDIHFHGFYFKKPKPPKKHKS